MRVKRAIKTPASEYISDISDISPETSFMPTQVGYTGDMAKTTNRKAILTMGLPGAGKSTVLASLGLVGEWTTVDPDLIKESHPDYDPKNPEALHEWSKQIANAEIAIAIAEGHQIIIDGTGTNAEKMIKHINTLQSAGYEVEVLYVQVSLATALARNAARPRTVPEHVVREKAELIAISFDILARYADTMTVIENN